MKRFAFALVLLFFLAPTTDAGGRSSYSGSSGRGSSYSGGRSSSSISSRPSSSGSRPSASSKPTTATSSKPTVTTTATSGKPTYSNTSVKTEKPVVTGKSGVTYGGTPTPPKAGSVSKKPTAPTYDTKAVKDYKTEESRKAYRAQFEKGTTAKTEYKSSSGKTVKVDPKDRRIQDLRSQLSTERWENRELRMHNTYLSYWNRPVVLYANDPYNSVFWWWLLDRSLEERAMWAYCHRPGYVSGMDEQRYRDLLAKDSALESRIRQLEAQKTPVNPSYVPSGMQPDLTYTEEFVDAAYNPTGKAQPVVVHNTAHEHNSSLLGWICFWSFVILLLGVLVYFVFFARVF